MLLTPRVPALPHLERSNYDITRYTDKAVRRKNTRLLIAYFCRLALRSAREFHFVQFARVRFLHVYLYRDAARATRTRRSPSRPITVARSRVRRWCVVNETVPARASRESRLARADDLTSSPVCRVPIPFTHVAAPSRVACVYT